METVHDAVTRAKAALEELARLGEAVEDEWQYVTDLESTWRARLEELAGARGSEALAPDVAMAIDRVAAEAALVDDPHRAIDWLSTLPQVVLVALGERT